MAFTQIIGFGGKLEVDISGYTDVGSVVDFGQNIDVAEVMVTDIQSQTSAPWYQDFIPGAVSVELTFNVRFDPGSTEHKNTLLDQINVSQNWRYTFTDGTIWVFPGQLRNISMSAPNEDVVAADVTIRVSGTPGYAGAA